MALLAQLLPPDELAKMSAEQRDFLVAKIDNLLNDKEIQRLIASKLQPMASIVNPNLKVAPAP